DLGRDHRRPVRARAVLHEGVTGHLTMLAVSIRDTWFSAAGWTFDPDVWILAIAGVIAFAIGRRRLLDDGDARAGAGWRAAMFYAGAATIVLALQSPVDTLADSMLSVHMVQHMLLLVVAAPLIAAGTPTPTFVRILPEAARIRLRELSLRADRTGPLGRAWDVATSPVTAVVAFVVTLWAWHLPVVYDLAVRSEAVHELEHATYLLVGLLFWSHVVGTSWLAARLSTSRRIAYVCIGMVSGWVLALALAFQPAPVYPPYVHAIASVSGMSPLDDQRLAAGLMWAIGMLPFNIALAAAVKRLLDAEEAAMAVESTIDVP
ncbi:MAG: cytochrome c oxidase assembly protein, partial [Actinomycetota bacterium]